MEYYLTATAPILAACLYLQYRAWGFLDIANPIVLSLNYNLVFLTASIPIYLAKIYPDYHLSESAILLILLSYPITIFFSYITQASIAPKLLLSRKLSRDRFSARGDGLTNIYAWALWGAALALAIAFFLRTDFITIKNIVSLTSFEDERVLAVQGMGIIILPAQVLIIIATTWIVSSSKASKILKATVTLTSLIILIFFGFRSGVAFLLLTISSSFIYYKYKSPPFGQLITIAIAIFIFLVATGTLRQGTDDFLDRFLARFFWRSFITAHNLETIISSYTELLYGRGLLMELAVLTPGPDINLGMHLKQTLNYDFPGGGITPSFIGTGFVDFGLVGALLYPAITGIILSISYTLWPMLIGRSRFSFILLTIFSVTTCGMSAAGFMSPLLYFGAPVVLMGISYRALALILKSSPRPMPSDQAQAPN